jgi:hypothetical protein
MVTYKSQFPEKLRFVEMDFKDSDWSEFIV